MKKRMYAALLCSVLLLGSTFGGGKTISAKAEAMDEAGRMEQINAKSETFGQAELDQRKDGTGAENGRSYALSCLNLPEEALRLVVVEAEGLKANVSMYERAGASEAWTQVVSTEEGLIGRKGMGKVREGDEKTPAGFYQMDTPFGTAAAQEGFPKNYLQVDQSWYWDGDSASDRYNQLVNVNTYTAFDRTKSEHLATYGGVSYRYCINTGYNKEGTPYRGSALFLHCSGGSNTAGCIAIPEAVMVTILQHYVEGQTYILLDTRGNFAQYERAETVTEGSQKTGASAQNGVSGSGDSKEGSIEKPARDHVDQKKGPCILSGSCG